MGQIRATQPQTRPVERYHRLTEASAISLARVERNLTFGTGKTSSTAFPICRTYGLGSEIDFVAPSVDDRVTIDVIDELDDALLQLVF